MKHFVRFCMIIGICFFLSSCGMFKKPLLVQPLDETIKEAAIKAKSAGATSIQLRTTITTAMKGSLSIPVSVLTIGAEGSDTRATEITINIPELQTWTVPNTERDIMKWEPKGVFTINKTGQLTPIK